MSLPTISPEIWLMILEETVLGDLEKGTNEFSNLMLVCHMWKNLVAPLLYRRLLFWQPHQIPLFVHHVYALKRMNEYPSRRTTSLCLLKLADLNLDGRDMLLLLRCFPKLQQLDSSLKLSWKELEVLADHCAQHLRVLDTCIDDRDGTGLAFTIIPRFHALEYMHLCIADPSPGRSPLHELPPFSLPHLKYLELRMAKHQKRNYAHYLSFLELCTFPALSHLRLSHLRHPEALTFSDFLYRHGPLLTRLDIEDVHPECLSIPFPNLVHLGIMWPLFDQMIDPQHLEAMIPPSVQVLHLCEGDCPSSDTVSFLQEFGHRRPPQAQLEAIQIEDPGFLWEDLACDTVTATGWLQPAFHLRKIGIALLDADGVGFKLEKSFPPQNGSLSSSSSVSRAKDTVLRR
ncbi:hypothetical protein DACRYDRAFT_109664 [Dacryopinax primogenitus]|uniref:F-box domain-containing protein n=1 Tax=Dacryopinax primogenitus (strain DJM 731) TaxID=1858805 RepID=M5FTV6_DACPD|nr:uncharacterized protein DACRYDRAFT_109664 [Dacryopinax primogenitus]EJT99568.1 hypothetical protein DACRYDRAFT_109664 [Dacryopinax primogenitus]